MKRIPPESSLKIKVETAFYNLLESNLSGVALVRGHDLLGEPPERCILVWCNSLGPFEDMPPSTGVKSAILTIRIELPAKELETTMDKLISTIQTVFDNAEAVRQFINLNGQNPDKRFVKLIHVYDLEQTGGPDMRSDEYGIEELVYSVTCGEHDG